jgi:DNA-binding PadR family transcriptional regulator
MVINPNYTALLILASLADGDGHGYGIGRDVSARTHGAVAPHGTTLYRSLERLRSAGLIERTRARPALRLDDPRRLYFRVTNAGRRVLAGEMRRLERVRRALRPARRSKGSAAARRANPPRPRSPLAES